MQTPSIFPLTSRSLDRIEQQISTIRADALENQRDGWSVARQIADLIHDARMAEFNARTDRRAARAKQQRLSRPA